MDWPLTAALGGLAAAIGLVGFGAVAVMQSDSTPAKRTPTAAVVAAPKPAPAPKLASAPSALTPAPALTPYAAPALTSYSAPPLAPAPVPEVVAPSVIVLAPAELVPDRVVPEPRRPVNLPLPRISNEPAPKAAKPVVAPAPAHPFSPPRETHIPGVMTGSEIARIKASLRLTSDQEPHWRPVEATLRDIGKQQLVQVRNGGKPDVDSSAMTRVYYAAQALLATLRPDQKEQVRRLARSMGYASVASML